MGQLPGGALIYGSRTALILEQPSEIQQAYAKEKEVQRESLSQREQDILSTSNHETGTYTEEVKKGFKFKSFMETDKPVFKRKIIKVSVC